MKNLESVRSKIIAAYGETYRAYELAEEEDTCRLADVLLAIGEHEGDIYEMNAAKLVGIIGVAKWNLRDDDLNQQSEELINFLDQIL